MEIYLVGGAVRDKLLGLPIQEKDWVVVGATPEQLTKQGYKAVGNSFPVFLHPKTKQEYALARTERKTKPGYKGFICDFSPTITLEEDLLRRDLTINAMAEDIDGNIIDPYNGQQDLRNKKLRHVSEAFIEDPVRVLRVARFLARFTKLGFTIASDTTALMKAMVKNGEIDHLVPERVWQELSKALQSDNPEQFFIALSSIQSTHRIFHLDESTNDEKNVHALQQCSLLTKETDTRFAAWASIFDADSIEKICKQLHAPKNTFELALLVNKHQNFYEACIQLPPPDILNGLKALDGFRRPDRFRQYLFAAEAVSRAKANQTDWPHPQSEYLYNALFKSSAITAKDLTKQHLTGKALAEELDMHRRAAISKIKRTYRWAKFD